MQKIHIGTTKNGIDVFLDRESSHAVTHIAHHSKLLDYIKRALPTIEVEGEIFQIEKDMGEEVGFCNLVETTDSDEIVYAMRPLRDQYSRFVKNKKPHSSSWITLDMRKVGHEYFLFTAFVGRLTPSFPGGDYLPEQSVKFWSTHALVYDPTQIIPGTETLKCPW